MEPAHSCALLKAAEMETHPTRKAMGRRSQVEVSQTRGLEGGPSAPWSGSMGPGGAGTEEPSLHPQVRSRQLGHALEPRALGVRGG